MKKIPEDFRFQCYFLMRFVRFLYKTMSSDGEYEQFYKNSCVDLVGYLLRVERLR